MSNSRGRSIDEEHEGLCSIFLEFPCLLAQVQLRQTKTSWLQSTIYYLQHQDGPWSIQPHGAGTTKDIRHLPTIFLHFRGTHGHVMLTSAARSSCQGRLTNLSPGGNSCVVTQEQWTWDSQQPGAASAGQAAEGNTKWRSMSGNHHFSKPHVFSKLIAHHWKYLLPFLCLGPSHIPLCEDV